MSRKFASNAKTPSSWGTAAQARLVAFAATSLAVFACGLYFWPTPIRGYIVEARLDAKLEHAGAVHVPDLPRARQLIREAVLSPQTVRQALRRAGPPKGVKRTHGGEFPSDAEVAFVARKLYVESLPHRDFEATGLSVGYTSQESDWGCSFLNLLLQQAVIELDQRAATAVAERQISKMESPLALAMRREEAALAALDGFLNRHFERLNQTPNAQLNKDQVPTPSRPQINPKWQTLQERLVAERSRLEQLLLDRLPEHPQAKESARRIEALQRQLSETPKFETDEPHASAGSRRRAPVQPVQFSDVSAPSAVSAGDEYERLLAELTESRVARRLAERELALRSQSESAQASSPIAHGTIVANARIVQTLREAPSTGRLTVLALSSILAGACLAAMLRTPRTSHVYSFAAEVEADLSLPVVAVVPIPEPSAVALSR